jgi:3,4-dihydroxy 2-butanone 4-phosphate synthase/GTP cyclohydrolase II
LPIPHCPFPIASPLRNNPPMPFSPIPEILDELRAGRMVVLTDDERRENEGDLVLPAQFTTPEAITFMLAQAKGYLCLSLTEADCDRLDLVPQASTNTSARGTAFTVSIDGHPRHGFTTGVSAKERARCIRMAIDPGTRPDDFVRPGHINPLRSRDGGVLVRTGQTEGSIDLCRLAGLQPAAIIMEVMRDDGEMARVPDLERFCGEHNLKMCSVNQIIEHRLARESLVRRLEPVAGVPLRTSEGEFTLHLFESLVDLQPQVVLTAGDIGVPDGAGRIHDDPRPTLVRMHRRNLLGDVFGELGAAAPGPESSSGETLRAAMTMIRAEGRGAVVYLRSSRMGEAPGAGLDAALGVDGLEDRLHTLRRPHTAPIAADEPELPAAHANGLRTSGVPRSQREFGIGGQILRALGLHKLRLITNHATAMPGLDAFGLEVVERVPVRASVTERRGT